ncbi:hypothetical protein [Streptomyces ossamyceticus]|uniref:hypothetical protein n=1 Tax=Streptomyces ossamyceticus TaxID=249581 RepID=UPI00342356F7
MRTKAKRLTIIGTSAIAILALSVPNASATSKRTEAKMKINPNCTVALYVDDHQYRGKIRAQAHFTCSRGDNLFTPSISIDRDGTHGHGRKSAGPKVIDEDRGFGGFETTTSDKSGTQCYRASLLIIYPDPVGADESQGVKTPCLNT